MKHFYLFLIFVATGPISGQSIENQKLEKQNGIEKTNSAIINGYTSVAKAELILEDGRKIDCTEGGYTTSAMNQCASHELQLLESKMETYLRAARKHYLEGSVQTEYNDDSEAGKLKAIENFDMAQKNWQEYRQNHCDSIYYSYKGGTIRGIVSLSCHIEIVKKRTWEIWSSWLTYQDSTPSILPEPDYGFVPESVIISHNVSQ